MAMYITHEQKDTTIKLKFNYNNYNLVWYFGSVIKSVTYS